MELKIDQPHTARMYDYYLGGKDNYPADREAAEQAIATFPTLRTTARANRSFLHRATRFLAGEAGIRQFLDIGTGIPTSPNLHEVAQEIARESRVVYVDNDPIVLAAARALLTGTPEGRTAYLEADLHDPAAILASAALRETFDLGRPVALSLIAVLHFFPDERGLRDIVRTLTGALPAGSYLTISHATGDFAPERMDELIGIYRRRGLAAQARGRAEIARLLDGLDLVDPGISVLHRWRPDSSDEAGLTDAEIAGYGVVARVP
ncbi:conserved hypothetical protein [Frankia canadensis]|uniref:Methyltransferase n=1 Tax=Frankia canadensis TaxID=1836972 RepID=A0A2I2KR65_9ACTN|nr:conserved hypothetical protein [Frankia canadensis]SOU55447.1 conserved hypothetical protein [Frankia canadensis]